MKKISLLAIIGMGMFLFSCSNKGDLCECIKAGNTVNKISADAMFKKHTKAVKDSLQEALQHRDAICQQFEKLTDKEIQEMAKDCSFLKFNPEAQNKK